MSEKLTVGELFAGIGGIGLGLERTGGFEVRWQVEANVWRLHVLARRWPNVARYERVEDVGAHNLERVDLIAGGFPCPVVSQAAAGRNVGEWSWPEMARIVRELLPRYVLVENTDGLRYTGRGFGEILGDLAESGYNAGWRVLPASLFGAPHRRARVWMVAYPHGHREPDLSLYDEAPLLSQHGPAVRDWPDPPEDVRVDDGISDRMDRLRALGNAVVPQVAEWIGARILEAEQHETAEARRIGQEVET